MIGKQQGTSKIGYPVFSNRVSNVRIFSIYRLSFIFPKNESWKKVLILIKEA